MDGAAIRINSPTKSSLIQDPCPKPASEAPGSSSFMQIELPVDPLTATTTPLLGHRVSRCGNISGEKTGNIFGTIFLITSLCMMIFGPNPNIKNAGLAMLIGGLTGCCCKCCIYCLIPSDEALET